MYLLFGGLRLRAILCQEREIGSCRTNMARHSDLHRLTSYGVGHAPYAMLPDIRRYLRRWDFSISFRG
jgi:hypothetical protein